MQKTAQTPRNRSPSAFVDRAANHIDVLVVQRDVFKHDKPAFLVNGRRTREHLITTFRRESESIPSRAAVGCSCESAWSSNAGRRFGRPFLDLIFANSTCAGNGWEPGGRQSVTYSRVAISDLNVTGSFIYI